MKNSHSLEILYPGLYISADSTSLKAQAIYYRTLRTYLLLLVLAALISFAFPGEFFGALISAILFMITLALLIFLRVTRPDDIWYNGRAVAESVKTRAWRWMMRAEPYEDTDSIERVSKELINDLKAILHQNRTISEKLDHEDVIQDPISEVMSSIRRMGVVDRINIYKENRINNQANWYALKSVFNKRKSKQWFIASILLHSIAIIMLLYRIKWPTLMLPVEVVATAAGAVLTWLQAKKHNELTSAYALAAHEITLIRGEALSIDSEHKLSEFVVNSESAFSREHTQWAARKTD